MDLCQFELENKTIEELSDLDVKYENQKLEITLLQIIYFNFIESNLVQIFKKITQAYEERSLSTFNPNFQQLTPLLKKLGAVRPYYICLKVKDIHEQLLNPQSQLENNVNNIWFMYPAMIESLHDYFCFLDFQYSLLHDKGFVLSKNIDQDCKTLFSKMFYSLSFPEDLNLIILCGSCYCVETDSDNCSPPNSIIDLRKQN